MLKKVLVFNNNNNKMVFTCILLSGKPVYDTLVFVKEINF